MISCLQTTPPPRRATFFPARLRACAARQPLRRAWYKAGRRALITAACLLIFACVSASPAHAQRPDTATLRRLAEAVVDTGLKFDHIPSLSKPAYVNVPSASLSLNSDEQVFVARFPGGVRIYPQRIMVYHEVVNEEVNGILYSITYSPLSGSLVGYHGRAGRFETSFGVSGSMLNANSVLFDRATGSLWPQLYGIAVKGPLAGTRLDRFPLLWTTWQRAARTYPNAMVLSRSTGYNRRYGTDPYGSYAQRDSYYHNQHITYPVLHTDPRLHPKERIAALLADDLPIALPHSLIRRDGVVNFSAGVTPMVAVWDRNLDTVRVYEREVSGKTADFIAPEGKLLDAGTRTEWSYDGEALVGVLRGNALRPVASMDSMWFAWAAFHPNTLIVPAP